MTERYTLESLKDCLVPALARFLPLYKVCERVDNGVDPDAPFLAIAESFNANDEEDMGEFQVFLANEDEQGYYVQHTELLSGCRTFSNGDPGYPDEINEVQDKYLDRQMLFPSEQTVVSHIIREILTRLIYFHLEAWEMELYCNESEQENG